MRGRESAVVLACAVLVLAGCAAPGSESAPPPQPSPSATPTPEPDEAEVRLAAMTTRQKVACLLMLHRPGTDAATLSAFLAETGAGGFLVMGDNVPGSAAALAPLTASLAVDPELPPLIAIDEEGGVVARLPDDAFPSAEELRALPPEASRDAYAARAALVASGGANLNFGIIADVTGDPGSFIADRVLGATPEDAAARVEQAVAGERGIVLSTLKHFPGHGLTEANSHFSVPASDISYEDWRAGPAVPFERGIAAGAEALMFGHLRLSAVDAAPASLSPHWHEIARNELGFDGLAVTDDLLMLQHSEDPEFADPLQNAIRAIDAGNDVLVYALAEDPSVSGVDPIALLDGLTAAVEDGRIPRERIDESAERVLRARITLREEG